MIASFIPTRLVIGADHEACDRIKANQGIWDLLGMVTRFTLGRSEPEGICLTWDNSVRISADETDIHQSLCVVLPAWEFDGGGGVTQAAARKQQRRRTLPSALLSLPSMLFR